jgi:group I intron endonuclease
MITGMMMSGIYAVRNENRSYIGSAVDIPGRWKRHRADLRVNKHHNPHLQNAWNKYGEDAFEFVILEECSAELLLEREQHYLDLYSNKYNILPVAGSHLGATRSPESRARISAVKMGNANRRGHKSTSEHKAKISAALMGHEVSDETREKMSIAAKARWARERDARNAK